MIYELHTLLFDFGRLLRPTSYLEIGVRDGDSFVKILPNLGWPAKVYLCDDWGTSYGGTGRGSHAHIDALVAEHKPALASLDLVYLDGSSHVRLKEISTTFQAITIDGDHSAAGAAQDLEDCWPLLQTNGFLFFDDIYHPSHGYLDDEMMLFLKRHRRTARLVYRVKFGPDTPGCAVIQRVCAPA